MTSQRRSAGTDAGQSASGSGADGQSIIQPGAGGQYLGVEDSQVEENPSRFVGEVFRGGFFVNTTIPESVPAGGSMTVTGEIQLDNPIATVVGKDIRVVMDSPSLSQDREQTFQGVMHGQSRSFSFDVPVPDSPGSEFAISLTAQENGTTGWVNGEELGPFRVSILTEEEAQSQRLLSYLPSVLLGGGAGLVADRATGGGNRATYALAGAALGAGAQAGGFTPGDLSFGIGGSLPDAQTIAIAGLGFAGIGFFLQSSGAADVLGPAGEAAGSAIDAGRQAAEGAVDAGREVANQRSVPSLTGGN